MTVFEIVDALQNRSRRVDGDIKVDEALLPKETSQLNLSEANQVIKATGISLDFIVNGKAVNHCDKEIDDYYKRVKAAKEAECRRNSIIQGITESIGHRIDSFDFLTYGGNVDAYKLLLLDDFELFEYASNNLNMEPRSVYLINSEMKPGNLSSGCCTDWEAVKCELHRIVGDILKDFRFTKYCCSSPEIATAVLNRLDCLHPLQTQDECEAIILLIDAGGLLYPHITVSGDATSYISPSYFLTQLMRDFCQRMLDAMKNA